MLYNVKHLLGETTHTSVDLVTVKADQDNVFGIPQLPAGATVEWTLKDQNFQETQLCKSSGNEGTVTISINKKLCGVYQYQLEATSPVCKINGVAVNGYCEPKIIRADWKSKDDKGEKVFHNGDKLKLTFEAEGLNGNEVIIEIYDEKQNELIKSITDEFVEGNLKTMAPGTDTYNWIRPVADDAKKKPKRPDEVDLVIKIKDKKGTTYYKDAGGSEDILKFKILRKDIKPSENIDENLALSAVKSKTEPVKLEVNGIVELIRIKIETDFDICSDEVIDNTDYANFWILKDEEAEEENKFYHWLKKRKTVSYSTRNTDENLKPKILPFTLHSEQDLMFHATFRVLFPINIDDIEFDVQQKKIIDPITGEETPTYQIKEIKRNKSSQLGKEEEFIVTFKADNKPYTQTIRYFEKFLLDFRFTLDGNVGIPLGLVELCLYLTWKVPNWNLFGKSEVPNLDDPGKAKEGEHEDKKMKIVNNENEKKRSILESLLWAGCKQANGIGKGKSTPDENIEEIMDTIFGAFEGLRFTRVREYIQQLKQNGLGYWKDEASFQRTATLNLRYLLGFGVGRCPHWTSLLIHIALCHDIKLDKMSISAGIRSSKDNKKELNSKKKTQFCNTVFLVNTCGWDIVDNDPTMVPIERDSGGDHKAQGYDKPLHFFWDHVLTCIQIDGKFKYYDPSYGIRSKEKADSEKELLRLYSEEAFDAVVFVKESENGSYFADLRHCEMDNIDLFQDYGFKSSNSKFEYKYLKKGDNAMHKGLFLNIIDIDKGVFKYNDIKLQNAAKTKNDKSNLKLLYLK